MAREFFLAEHGREPMDARELAGQIAKNSRPRTQTVAGYDLTFSPVKSVSTLWAVADPAVAAVIEQAHQAAVQDALAFIEKHALFTRTGRQGVRQVNVRGLVGTAFTHRDSRAGIRICTPTSRWRTKSRPRRTLAIDRRPVLFKANVADGPCFERRHCLTGWVAGPRATIAPLAVLDTRRQCETTTSISASQSHIQFTTRSSASV